jgi:hypothetical protein
MKSELWQFKEAARLRIYNSVKPSVERHRRGAISIYKPPGIVTRQQMLVTHARIIGRTEPALLLLILPSTDV